MGNPHQTDKGLRAWWGDLCRCRALPQLGARPGRGALDQTGAMSPLGPQLGQSSLLTFQQSPWLGLALCQPSWKGLLAVPRGAHSLGLRHAFRPARVTHAQRRYPAALTRLCGQCTLHPQTPCLPLCGSRLPTTALPPQTRPSSLSGHWPILPTVPSLGDWCLPPQFWRVLAPP